MEKNSVIIGSEKSVQTMIYYLMTALIDAKVKDPKQYIATEISKMIDLSEEQAIYVQNHLSKDNRVLDNLSSSISLLKSIEKQEKLDMESIKIVRSILELMHDECKDVLNKIRDGDIENECR